MTLYELMSKLNTDDEDMRFTLEDKHGNKIYKCAKPKSDVVLSYLAEHVLDWDFSGSPELMIKLDV